jgi:hypothetical protein
VYVKKLYNAGFQVLTGWLWYKAIWSVECHRTFQRNMSPSFRNSKFRICKLLLGNVIVSQFPPPFPYSSVCSYAKTNKGPPSIHFSIYLLFIVRQSIETPYVWVSVELIRFMRLTAINTKANSSLQEYIFAVHTSASFYKGFCSMGCPLHVILNKELKEQVNTAVRLISLNREEFEYYPKIVVVFLSSRCHIVASMCDSRWGFG